MTQSAMPPTDPPSCPCLAIEIGGTKLQAAIGAADGAIWRRRRTEAEPASGRVGILNQIDALVESLLSESMIPPSSFDACGIGFGGPVDSGRGIVLNSHQVSGWDDFDLVGWFSDRFNIPTRLGNDSDLAGWAEARLGAGEGFTPVVYMNIGSGIGGAFVIDGALYRGQGLGAAEIGHLRIVPGDGPADAWKTLESVCSGWALGAQAGAILGAQVIHPTAADLENAFRRGNPAAVAAWTLAIERLGVAIANVAALLHPRKFVIGGGVSLLGDRLFEPLRNAVAKQMFAPFAAGFEIVPAALGEDVVLHGGLLLAGD